MHNLSAKHCAQNTRTGYLLPRFVDPQILTPRWIERLGVNCTANGIDVPSARNRAVQSALACRSLVSSARVHGISPASCIQTTERHFRFERARLVGRGFNPDAVSAAKSTRTFAPEGMLVRKLYLFRDRK